MVEYKIGDWLVVEKPNSINWWMVRIENLTETTFTHSYKHKVKGNIITTSVPISKLLNSDNTRLATEAEIVLYGF